MSAAKLKSVNCPSCGKPSLWEASNPFRPFCSERCKLIDLGQWAAEGYRIPLADSEPEPQSDNGPG